MLRSADTKEAVQVGTAEIRVDDHQSAALQCELRGYAAGYKAFPGTALASGDGPDLT